MSTVERDFVQLVPAEREGRASLWSKESLEKYRLKQRREKHLKIDPPKHPLEQVGGAMNPARATNTEMFERDSAAKEFNARIRLAKQYERMIDARKLKGAAREHTRMNDLEAMHQRQQDAVVGLQDRPISLRNRGGAEYNILTFAYSDTDGGRALEAKDDATKERAKHRAGRLYQHGNHVTHNIITGTELRTPCSVPQQYAILAPWER